MTLFDDIRNPRLAQLIKSLNATVEAAAQASADAIVSDPATAQATDHVAVARYLDDDSEWVEFSVPTITDYRD